MSAATVGTDIAQAQAWYESLSDNGDELEQTEWRAINKHANNGRGDVVSMVGTLDEVADDLTAYNLKGYSIYAVINRVHPDALSAIKDGRPIRIKEDGKPQYLTSDEDIVGIRAVWFEIDRAEAKPGDNLKRVEEGPATPSLLLRSSEPHKLHGYFILDDGMVDNAEFTRVQLALAGYYGGDTTVSNPARIMRVPGFFNTKPKKRADWKLAQLLDEGGPTYTRASIFELYADAIEQYGARSRGSNEGGREGLLDDLLAEAQEAIDEVRRGGAGRHPALTKLAKVYRLQGLDRASARFNLTTVADSLPPRDGGEAVPDNEIDEILEWVWANYDPPRSGPSQVYTQGGRPEIVVNGRYMRDITDEVLKALQAANDPLRLFVRAGIPVRVNSEARAEALTTASLKGEMDRAADHVKEEFKTDKDGETERTITPARPPTDVANDILALPSLPFPELRAIAHVPQVLPGGAILCRDGYDPETGILLRLQGLDTLRLDMPLAEARAILIDELLGDFPFIDNGSRAHAVAMLLQPFLMPIITGPTPLGLIDAPTRGTGKTLLYQVVAYIVLGAYPAVMTLTREGDELDKRITASLLEGDVMIVLDNIAAKLSSDKLAAVLTSRRYRGRRLGKSEMLTVNNDATWVATGNNVEVSDEMARRIMPIRLDAKLERPEEGRTFKHPDLLAFVKRNRPRLVSACLSLIRSWVEAGMVESNTRVGSYESWAGIIGGILAHANIPGLLEGRERFAKQADQETTEWSALTAAWWSTFGERAVNASEIFRDVIRAQSLLMDTWAGRSHLSAMQRIGRALSSRRDRVYGDYVIRDAGRDAITRNAAYRLEQIPQKTPGETPGNTRNTHQNTRGKNTVQDDENDPERVFRVFDTEVIEKIDDLIGATEGEI